MIDIKKNSYNNLDDGGHINRQLDDQLPKL